MSNDALSRLYGLANEYSLRHATLPYVNIDDDNVIIDKQFMAFLLARMKKIELSEERARAQLRTYKE